MCWLTWPIRRNNLLFIKCDLATLTASLPSFCSPPLEEEGQEISIRSHYTRISVAADEKEGKKKETAIMAQKISAAGPAAAVASISKNDSESGGKVVGRRRPGQQSCRSQNHRFLSLFLFSSGDDDPIGL
jgi:hypothetical protein